MRRSAYNGLCFNEELIRVEPHANHSCMYVWMCVQAWRVEMHAFGAEELRSFSCPAPRLLSAGHCLLQRSRRPDEYERVTTQIRPVIATMEEGGMNEGPAVDGEC